MDTSTPCFLEAQAEDQEHIPLQKSWQKEDEWGFSNRPLALSYDALLPLGVGGLVGGRVATTKPKL